MSENVPVIWMLIAFNGLFLAAYVFRRMAGRPPLSGPVSFLLQSCFVAANCLILFQEEAQRYVNWLTGFY